ncbi:acyl-homoserine-lactone synthase [Mesorhizobium sp. B1-1-8]|uniref:acyl-homoserine-lactone synthase n=1 Tax=Mesorhizobium sp. B1-1-8 TaxID=2589976 RepID=UPI00112A4473|nr:acyl-homoserine-lactone synthase [Mesorhizobium sp. B1-1-8]UCI10553.1 autoinducer synthesis protein [Mesorhizobium sp. B1-1-8]
MFQVHVVDKANRLAYEGYLDTYFRLRHDIYVGERGWHELRRADGKEVDAFDTCEAVYLIGIDPHLGVVAGSRLISTVRPHLMSEVFPGLADGAVPRRDDTFEWTRFFVVRALREAGRPCRAAGVLYCAVQEYGLLRGIRHVTVVCEDYWQRRFQSIGWNPRRLGMPLPHDGTSLVGLMLDISASALRATRDAYEIADTVLGTAAPHFAQD